MTPFEKYLEETRTDIKAMKNNIADMLAKLNDKSNKKIEKHIHPMSVQIKEISSKHNENIQNEMLAITSEHTYSEYNFERKFHDNISPNNQGFEQPEK